MNSINRKLHMSWLAVIIFAAVAGCYTGWIMTIDSLKETSFQDIGISYECWIIFAVIIVVSCKKSWEAMLKCFVFFLISQPLVFAVEFLLGHLNADMAVYYYTTNWLPKTFLTLPGGFIAYFCKKQNLLGSVILGLGNTIMLFFGIHYTASAIKNFPLHTISAIICYTGVFAMSLLIQKHKRNRLISLLLPIILVLIAIIVLKLTGRTI